MLGVAMDVTDRVLSQERLLTTARELQHRVKNSLTIVQSIATQSFRLAATKEEGLENFSGRLRALAIATDLMTRGNWQSTPAGAIVEEIVRPYRKSGSTNFVLSGGQATVGSENAVSLGMALHELCTNALKYGALAVEGGKVTITWRAAGGDVVVDWLEQGGPPVKAPRTRGFGMKLLQQGLFKGSGGGVELDLNPDGVRARISIRNGTPERGGGDPEQPIAP
jgi:two-component sensor histidine kinase